LLFGFSFIGYSYLFSFIFQKSTTAYRFFPFLNLIFFYFIPLIPSINSPNGVLAQYIMPLISPFIAFTIFFNTEEVVGSNFGQTTAFSHLAVSYGALFIQAIVYFSACLFLERLRFSLKSNNQHLIPQQQPDFVNNYVDPRIQSEVHQRQSVGGNYPIKIDNLTKIYGNGHIAIRNNSFSVKTG